VITEIMPRKHMATLYGLTGAAGTLLIRRIDATPDRPGRRHDWLRASFRRHSGRLPLGGHHALVRWEGRADSLKSLANNRDKLLCSVRSQNGGDSSAAIMSSP